MMTSIAPLALVLATLSDPQDVVAALETAVADAIERAQPSVVAVTRIKGEGDATLAVRGRNPNPVPAPGPAQAAELQPGLIDAEPVRPGFPQNNSLEYFAMPGDFGAGVVIGPNNEILTCYHILIGAERIRVRALGAQFDAEIIAADPRTDLAVIVPRQGSEPPTKLSPIPIGDSTKLRQGSFLVALGNPYNAARDGKASASMGILANTARRVEPPTDGPAERAGPNIKQFFRFQPTLLQLDSKLNLGMSGGAVINLRGELVGITTSVASPSGYDAAAGYAIPMDPLGRRAVNTLLQGKEVEYGFIGIGLGRRPNTVTDVRQGSPAWKADLKTGDTILTVGDIELAEDESALPLALASVPVGEPVKLRVLHEGQVKERTLVMSKYPVSTVLGEVIATTRPTPWRGARIDFTSMLTDGMDTNTTLEAMTRGGVGVVEVATSSPSAEGGLTKGLVITEVEGRPVSTPQEFHAAVQKLEGKPVTLTTFNGQEDGKKVVVPAK
jgi:S1-C subfamily serine protease